MGSGNSASARGVDRFEGNATCYVCSPYFTMAKIGDLRKLPAQRNKPAAIPEPTAPEEESQPEPEQQPQEGLKRKKSRRHVSRDTIDLAIDSGRWRELCEEMRQRKVKKVRIEGDPVTALQIAVRAAYHDRTSAECWNLLGDMIVENGELEKMAEEGINPAAMDVKGVRMDGDFISAFDCYARAMELDPHDPRPVASMAYFIGRAKARHSDNCDLHLHAAALRMGGRQRRLLQQLRSVLLVTESIRIDRAGDDDAHEKPERVSAGSDVAPTLDPAAEEQPTEDPPKDEELPAAADCTGVRTVDRVGCLSMLIEQDPEDGGLWAEMYGELREAARARGGAFLEPTSIGGEDAELLAVRIGDEPFTLGQLRLMALTAEKTASDGILRDKMWRELGAALCLHLGAQPPEQLCLHAHSADVLDTLAEKIAQMDEAKEVAGTPADHPMIPAFEFGSLDVCPAVFAVLERTPTEAALWRLVACTLFLRQWRKRRRRGARGIDDNKLEVFMHRGKPMNLIDILSTVLTLEPNCADAWWQLSETLRPSGTQLKAADGAALAVIAGPSLGKLDELSCLQRALGLDSHAEGIWRSAAGFCERHHLDRFSLSDGNARAITYKECLRRQLETGAQKDPEVFGKLAGQLGADESVVIGGKRFEKIDVLKQCTADKVPSGEAIYNSYKLSDLPDERQMEHLMFSVQLDPKQWAAWRDIGLLLLVREKELETLVGGAAFPESAPSLASTALLRSIEIKRRGNPLAFAALSTLCEEPSAKEPLRLPATNEPASARGCAMEALSTWKEFVPAEASTIALRVEKWLEVQCWLVLGRSPPPATTVVPWVAGGILSASIGFTNALSILMAHSATHRTLQKIAAWGVWKELAESLGSSQSVLVAGREVTKVAAISEALRVAPWFAELWALAAVTALRSPRADDVIMFNGEVQSPLDCAERAVALLGSDPSAARLTVLSRAIACMGPEDVIHVPDSSPLGRSGSLTAAEVVKEALKLRGSDQEADGALWHGAACLMAEGALTPEEAGLQTFDECITNALAFNPRDSWMWWLLSRSMIQQHIHIKTISSTVLSDRDALRICLELDGSIAGAWTAQAMLLRSTEYVTILRSRYSRLECALRALELDREIAWAWFLAGLGLDPRTDDAVTVAGTPHRCIDCLLRCLELDSRISSAWSYLACVLLLVPALQSAQVPGLPASVIGTQRIIECALRAVQCDLGNATAWLLLGLTVERPGTTTTMLGGHCVTRHSALRAAVELMPLGPATRCDVDGARRTRSLAFLALAVSAEDCTVPLATLSDGATVADAFELLVMAAEDSDSPAAEAWIHLAALLCAMPAPRDEELSVEQCLEKFCRARPNDPTGWALAAFMGVDVVHGDATVSPLASATRALQLNSRFGVAYAAAARMLAEGAAEQITVEGVRLNARAAAIRAVELSPEIADGWALLAALVKPQEVWAIGRESWTAEKIIAKAAAVAAEPSGRPSDATPNLPRTSHFARIVPFASPTWGALPLLNLLEPICRRQRPAEHFT